MCGIAGIIAQSGWTKNKLWEAGVYMASTMHHRGPDTGGIWIDPEYPIMLAHRRLAIQDLSSAGHQPMTSLSGRFHIVYNGEIYNFHSFYDELSKLGWKFRGHSDTEILLAAIEEWGIEETLVRSHGMFAIGIWDQKERVLTLCRDRMGEKPLFFGWLEKCFVFASELKALHSIFHSSLTVDPDAIASFFRFGYIPTPYAIYRNIFKLLPGTFLCIPAAPLPSIHEFHPLPGMAKISPKPYWQIEKVIQRGISNIIKDDKEAIERLDFLLHDTIRQQIIADVPIGSFLSGGIDSSLVAAVMQAVSEKPIITFTIGFKEKEFDEAPYARSIAKHIGSNHHEYYISANDGLYLIEAIPQFWDEPFADSSQIPSLLLAKVARQEVKVCLTGDGGDELFCGYNRYFITMNIWAKRQKLPYWLRKVVGKTITTIPPHIWQKGYFILKWLTDKNHTQANVGLKIHKLANLLQMDSIHDAYRYLISCWQEGDDIIIRNTNETLSIIDRQPNPGLAHFMQVALYWDQLGYLVDDNLTKGDRASMAVSLELRLPLLDHRIVEFSWQLPIEMKYRERRSKWILRQVLYKYVPKVLIERPKMGFSVPIGDWLRGPLKNWAADLLHSNGTEDIVGMNKQTIQKVWRQHLSGSHDHSHKLWTLCIWLDWAKKYGSSPKSDHGK